MRWLRGIGEEEVAVRVSGGALGELAVPRDLDRLGVLGNELLVGRGEVFFRPAFFDTPLFPLLTCHPAFRRSEVGLVA